VPGFFSRLPDGVVHLGPHGTLPYRNWCPTIHFLTQALRMDQSQSLAGNICFLQLIFLEIRRDYKPCIPHSLKWFGHPRLCDLFLLSVLFAFLQRLYAVSFLPPAVAFLLFQRLVVGVPDGPKDLSISPALLRFSFGFLLLFPV